MMQGFNKIGGIDLVKSLHELERQNGMMTVQSEMIDDQLDSVFEEENDNEEMDDVILEVMREAGVDLPSASTELMSLEERLEKITKKTNANVSYQ